MRFGGATITPSDDDRQFISSYFILDITDPERPPTLLGEMTRTTEENPSDHTKDLYADLGFSTPMPTGVVMKDTINKWYLVFGNGPTSLNGENTQQGKVAVLPLVLNTSGVLENGFRIPADLPTATTAGVIPVVDASDTSNKFISDMMTVDYDLEVQTDPILGALYKSDALYFGTVDGSLFTGTPGNTSWTGGGGVYRLVTRKLGSDGNQVSTTPNEWHIEKLIDTEAPVTGGLSVGWDYSNFWIYFGTGRFFATDDKTDATDQRFFGVKEPLDEHCEMTWDDIDWSGTSLNPKSAIGLRGLVRADNIQVVESGTYPSYDRPVVFCPSGSETDIANITDIDYCNLSFLGTPLGTTDGIKYYSYEVLRQYIAGEKRSSVHSCPVPDASSTIGVDGWYRLLQDPRERVIGQSALLGGLITFTSYQPFADLCTAEGMSNLYGVHYQTGTAWYENVFGTSTRDGRTVVLDKLPLGIGLTGTPSMHSGGSSVDAKVFVQSSTGEIIEIEQKNLPIQPPKSGRADWCDDCN